MYQVGDAPIVTYHLADATTTPPTPADATVTLTITDPAGAAVTVTPAHPSTGVYQHAVPLTAEGLWTVTWTATGALTDTETIQLYAAGAGTPQTGQRPAWAPQLEDVAVHIPSRTRDTTSNDPVGTFTANTTPTGEQVARLIDHATTWVLGATGAPVMPAAYAQCGVAASLWAAYWVELGWPERDADVTVYERLRTDADAQTKTAAALNAGAGGGTSTDPAETGSPAVPTYSFPAPPAWADTSLYW